jgi:hypothetical protein
MENLYIKLLREFESTGLSSKKSISKFMAENFKKPTALTFIEWEKKSEDSLSFLNDVERTGHFEIKEYQIAKTRWNSNTASFKWYDEIEIDARLTIEGLAYLENHIVNNRVTNSTVTQTKILYLTALFALGNIIIAIMSINASDLKDRQQIFIQEQSKQIHTLQIELSQLTSLKFQVAKENNTSMQKKH